MSADAKLSRQEIHTLVVRAKGGDLDARDRVFFHFVSMVHQIAHGFVGVDGMDHDDLANTGSIGLMKAIECYYPDSSGWFGTVAHKYIFWEIAKEVRRGKRDAMFGAVGMSPEGGDSPPLGSQDVCPSSPLLARESREVLASMFALWRQSGELTTSYADILEMSFGLRGRDPLSNQKIGDRLGINRERVRVLRARALRWLAGRLGVTEKRPRTTVLQARRSFCSSSHEKSMNKS